MSKKFASDLTSNGAVAAGDKLLIQKVADSTVNYILVSDLFTAVDVVKLGTSSVKLALAGATTRAASIYTTSSIDTAANLSSFTVSQTQTGASAVNSIEVGQFILTSAVKLGQWANAVLGKVDLSTAGYSAGIVGAICAEVDFPSGGITGGSGQYHCFEAELNLAGATGGVPMSFMVMNLWGANKAEFDTYGDIFNIQGIADHSTGKVFQVNTATAATHALRIKINNEKYYIMLTDTGA